MKSVAFAVSGATLIARLESFVRRRRGRVPAEAAEVIGIFNSSDKGKFCMHWLIVVNYLRKYCLSLIQNSVESVTPLNHLNASGGKLITQSGIGDNAFHVTRQSGYIANLIDEIGNPRTRDFQNRAGSASDEHGPRCQGFNDRSCERFPVG